MDWIQDFFAKKYRNLKLTLKLSAGTTEYHSINGVVPNRYNAFTLENLAMAATLEQIHVDQLMTTTRQMTKTDKILREQPIQITETDVFLTRQGQEYQKFK